MWLERNINATPVLFSTSSFSKELLRYVPSHYFVKCMRCILYFVAFHSFLLECLFLCWSTQFTLRCKKHTYTHTYIYYFYNVCSLVINMMIHKVQDFFKLVLYIHDSSIWFCGVHQFQILSHHYKRDPIDQLLLKMKMMSSCQL